MTEQLAQVRCSEPGCALRAGHDCPHIGADGREWIRVTPSPEMRAVVLAAAGLEQPAHEFSEEPDAVYPSLKRAVCSCGWRSAGYTRMARHFWSRHAATVTS